MTYYIYNTDVYCEACGLAIKADCDKANREDGHGNVEPSEDSNEYPQRCDDNGESDCPQHCGSGAECLEPTIIDNYVDDPVGKFLENDLTADGVEYVVQAFMEYPDQYDKTPAPGRRSPNVARFWMQYYLDNGYTMETDFHGFKLSISK